MALAPGLSHVSLGFTGHLLMRTISCTGQRRVNAMDLFSAKVLRLRTGYCRVTLGKHMKACERSVSLNMLKPSKASKPTWKLIISFRFKNQFFEICQHPTTLRPPDTTWINLAPLQSRCFIGLQPGSWPALGLRFYVPPTFSLDV